MNAAMTSRASLLRESRFSSADLAESPGQPAGEFSWGLVTLPRPAKGLFGNLFKDISFPGRMQEARNAPWKSAEMVG
jgi:hypothetical protein